MTAYNRHSFSPGDEATHTPADRADYAGYRLGEAVAAYRLRYPHRERELYLALCWEAGEIAGRSLARSMLTKDNGRDGQGG